MTHRQRQRQRQRKRERELVRKCKGRTRCCLRRKSQELVASRAHSKCVQKGGAGTELCAGSTRAFPSCWLATPALREDWHAASTLLPTWLTSLSLSLCQSTRVTCAAEGGKKGAGPQIRQRRRRGAFSCPFLACPRERRQGIDGGGEGVRPTT